MTKLSYIAPETWHLDIQTENILCQSGNLSDYEENTLFDQFTQTGE